MILLVGAIGLCVLAIRWSQAREPLAFPRLDFPVGPGVPSVPVLRLAHEFGIALDAVTLPALTRYFRRLRRVRGWAALSVFAAVPLVFLIPWPRTDVPIAMFVGASIGYLTMLVGTSVALTRAPVRYADRYRRASLAPRDAFAAMPASTIWVIRVGVLAIVGNVGLYACVRSDQFDAGVRLVASGSVLAAVLAEPMLRLAARRLTNRALPGEDRLLRIDLLLRSLSVRYLAGVAIALVCVAAALGSAVWSSHQTLYDFSMTPVLVAFVLYLCGGVVMGALDPQSIGTRSPLSRWAR